ncbi:AMP-binding protein [Amycolatopsis acidiphila]|uniref:AMP-binding protein n=1 Tax=Amycolatopsis acidiphila TaxID=715473 RepID=A0A557ZV42_9PSEU|nr:AMP-binding protein [Amycolatopsis acidiphila]TVT15850.1 AMP-binding protein [Amycolatopsis acidiphila]UIJ57697.1 AMP-binding protein [Amycolatopsis acidiphila]GHG95280.1 short chain acyl-CoA synthetase [Amycolatopsis acidiphila]
MNAISDQFSRSAEYRAAGYWGDDTVAAVIDRWAAADPDHPYVSDGTSEFSYGEFRDRAWNLAAALAEHGVKPGDRVAVQLPNWTEYFLIYAACARLGAVMIPIVAVYRAGEVGFIVESSGAVALITCGEFRGFDHAAMAAEVAESASDLLFRAVVRGTPADGALSLTELLETDHDLGALPPLPSADDPHLVLYSSGTESRPKGCLHTWNSSSFLPKQAVRALGLGRSDVMFMPAPVTHALGLTLGVMAPTLAGASVHLLDVFDPKTALERIARYRCTGTASPAPFLRMMLDAYEPGSADVSGLRFWLSAGAPIPATLVEEAASKFSGCRVVSAYGSSEVMMATVCLPDDPPARVASSDGLPVPGVEVRIVGADGEPAAPGVEGEIRYRGPGRLLEYWGRPDLTARAIDEEGWWCTGDLGRLDESGYLRVTGRIKDIIIRGGFNISAREVEEALLAHPTVANVAVVGLPDPVTGERACAVIQQKGSHIITLEEMKRYLTEERKMAVWKVPERVEFVDELPVTATGKIQKFVLRDRFHPAVSS